jgi:hypothetical protein
MQLLMRLLVRSVKAQSAFPTWSTSSIAPPIAPPTAHRRLNLSGQPRRRAHLLRLAQRHQLHWHEVLLFTATGLTILCLLTPIVLFN